MESQKWEIGISYISEFKSGHLGFRIVNGRANFLRTNQRCKYRQLFLQSRKQISIKYQIVKMPCNRNDIHRIVRLINQWFFLPPFLNQIIRGYRTNAMIKQLTIKNAYIFNSFFNQGGKFFSHCIELYIWMDLLSSKALFYLNGKISNFKYRYNIQNIKEAEPLILSISITIRKMSKPWPSF